MYSFLDKIFFERGKNGDLASLLGGMSLYENKEDCTMDSAAWEDWKFVVGDNKLDLNNVYHYMIRYIKEFNKTYNSKYLDRLIEYLEVSFDKEENNRKEAYRVVKKDITVGMIKFMDEDNN